MEMALSARGFRKSHSGTQCFFAPSVRADSDTLLGTPRSAACFARALRSFIFFTVPFGHIQEWCSEGSGKGIRIHADCCFIPVI